MEKELRQNSRNKSEAEKVETENIEDLKRALAAEHQRYEAALAAWQRAQADYINLRRVTDQEKAETCAYANADLLLNLLPALDDLSRALDSIPADQAKSPWVEGLKLIYLKIWNILGKEGVNRIKTLSEEFDPRFMEALATGKGKKDFVIQELEPGYTLNGRVIRPAKVIVGSGEE